MLKAGDRAPELDLEDARGKTWTLAELSGGRVIVYFYPVDDTPGCTIQACDFRDAHRELKEAGCTVLGISPQDARSHDAFSSKHNLSFPLLIDDELKVARAYGVDADEGSYEGAPLEVQRSTFVIDEGGIILEARYGVNARGHIDELKRVLNL